MKFLIGVDVGTQSLRACLFDLDGNMQARASAAYPTYRKQVGWVEQNPRDWIDALVSSIVRLLKESGVPPDAIVGLSYACTSCTVVALDQNFRPVRNGLMWMDERAHRQAERISATEHPVLRYGGGKESPQWMLPKAMWLAENEPEIYAKTRWLVEQTDFITYTLTGRMTISRSNAAAKWHYATPLGGWQADWLRDLGMESLMPKWPVDVIAVGVPVGYISSTFAHMTGLTSKTMVSQGGVDAHASMVGAGGLREGDMTLAIGTSSCHMAQSSIPVKADVWGPYPEAVEDGIYTIGGGQSTTGSILQWLMENFRSPNESYQEIEKLVSQVPPGSNGLIALDYFQGNRTPFKDPMARGAIWGLTLNHGFPDIYRSFCEAVAYGTRAILENLAQNNYLVRQLIATGGGTKSSFWMQMHADVTKIPVRLVISEEPTALGAAIWAGLGAGVFKDYQGAFSKMVHYGEILEPNLELQAEYDFYYQKYIETYQQLKPLMHAVAEHEEGFAKL